jgi:hypothetical protein
MTVKLALLKFHGNLTGVLESVHSVVSLRAVS